MPGEPGSKPADILSAQDRALNPSTTGPAEPYNQWKVQGMTQDKLSIAIVGAEMGGLAAAETFQQIGVDAQIYEQAAQFIGLEPANK